MAFVDSVGGMVLTVRLGPRAFKLLVLGGCDAFRGRCACLISYTKGILYSGGAGVCS